MSAAAMSDVAADTPVTSTLASSSTPATSTPAATRPIPPLDIRELSLPLERAASHRQAWNRGAAFKRSNTMAVLPSARKAEAEATPRFQQQDTARRNKVDILASYSPRMLTQRFTENPKPPAKASQVEFRGAIVFVDVSGFTALSEALSKEHGAVEGAELLNLYINAYMRKIIECIEKAGGDIIKFAGDAMQVSWHGPSHAQPSLRHPPHLPQASDGDADVEEQDRSLSNHVLTASRCCVSMLTDLHGFSPVAGVTLKLHIGIGAGAMDAYTVGGHLKKW